MGATMMTDGRIAVPQEVRDVLGLTPGTSVAFDIRPDGQVVLRRGADLTFRERLDRVRGIAKGGLTTEEVMAVTRGDD